MYFIFEVLRDLYGGYEEHICLPFNLKLSRTYISYQLYTWIRMCSMGKNMGQLQISCWISFHTAITSYSVRPRHTISVFEREVFLRQKISSVSHFRQKRNSNNVGVRGNFRVTNAKINIIIAVTRKTRSSHNAAKHTQFSIINIT